MAAPLQARPATARPTRTTYGVQTRPTIRPDRCLATIHPPRTIRIIRPLPWATTEQDATTAALSIAGAAVVGAAVGVATGAAIASSQSAAASQNAYAQGYNAGASNPPTLLPPMRMRPPPTPMQRLRMRMSPLPAPRTDGRSLWGVTGWLHPTQRCRWRDLLFVRQHMVQSGLWREWRALYGGARSVAIRVVVASVAF